jgi:lipoate-protein ligase A
LLAHLEVKAIEEGGEEESEAPADDDDAEEDQFVQKYRKVTPNIQDFWIKLVPDLDQFINALLKTFQEGLQAIKCFERWSKHSDLLKYSEALETWDDKVGEDWGDQNLESTALEPGTWITEHPI